MAPTKRKVENETQPNNPKKKQKSALENGLKTSTLREEGPAFARGGASILTPLEQKQIQVKAKQDVLFEQSGSKRTTTGLYSDGEDSVAGDIEDRAENRTQANSASKKKIKSKKSKLRSQKPVERSVRAEGLSYRRIVPGSQILGQVSKVNRYDVTVTLPNNLMGYLPLTSISRSLTERAEQLAAENSDDDGSGSKDESSIDLEALFYVGQYLRVYVVSVGASKDKDAQKKHIELSALPRHTNLGIDSSNIPRSATVQVEVISVEDHGAVVDLGLEGSNVKGFIPLKEFDPIMQLGDLQKGTVILSVVTGQSANGKVVKLSANPQRMGNLKTGNILSEPQSIDAFLPGSAVEVLVSEVLPSGVVGKVFGVLDATSDIIHSGDAVASKSLSNRFSPGTKVKARVIFALPTSEGKGIGVSFLDHVLSMSVKRPKDPKEQTSPVDLLPISSFVNTAIVAKVDSSRGLFLDLGIEGIRGFAHISRISDEKIDSLSDDSGLFKVGSSHRCRIVGYNSVDGLYMVSLEPKVLGLPFLRLDDIKAGQIVKGTVTKLVSKDMAIEGAVINITESISGFVPEMHLADVRLQYPERKFKEGLSVSARVLSVDLDSRRLRLTLKKTLVNSDAPAWTSYDSLKAGMQAPGTLTNVHPSGAVVQFYGAVRAFLPVSQMSESYISDATLHFRSGQVVNVRILSVDANEERMIVSCRDPDSFGPEQEQALEQIKPGQKVQGRVSEKTSTDIIIELSDSALKATLPIDHLIDGSLQKCLSAAKRIRVGQSLHDISVVGKDISRHMVWLTSKRSLIKALASGSVPDSFEDLVVGSKVTGFVNNITPKGVFVQFANSLTGLLPNHRLLDEAAQLVDFGLRKSETIEAVVLSVDSDQRRFLLSHKPIPHTSKSLITSTSKVREGASLDDVVDGVSTSLSDFNLGKLTKVKVLSVKETQLNVQLAANVFGRIDVSEIFDSWEEIKDRKHPLRSFNSRQELQARIMGIHDSKNHRFLPITHIGRAPVFELTAKESALKNEELDILTIDKITEGTTWLCFVNNIEGDYVWVNLSPNVRGRIRAMDVSDDLSLLADLEKHFPVGSVIRARVVRVDHSHNQLDLSAKNPHDDPLAIDKLSEGMILPGRVTKVTERYVMVQLSEALSAPIFLANLTDDFEKANPTMYEKYQIIRVCILKVDAPNKRLLLSARPSKVLSSSLPVVDREILKISSLKMNDILRGFIKHVADNGILVNIGGDIDAFVKVSNLSDKFIKDWKEEFEIDKLVRGKVVAIDVRANKVQLSLKESVLDANYKPPLTYSDLQKGQVVTGSVRKVADFGVFIAIDNSSNVSGLCHRSEMVDGPAPDVQKLYNEKDRVKAKVLSVDLEKRRVSLGLKASYLENEEDHLSDSIDSENGGVVIGLDEEMDSVESDQDIDTPVGDTRFSHTHEGLKPEIGGLELRSSGSIAPTYDPDEGLRAGDFDWTGDILDKGESESNESSSDETEAPRRKKRRKAEIKIDQTAHLDINGPQSTADFERLLMGQPNSSYLWISYMAFYLQLGEVNKAREMTERALKTINSHTRDGAEESLNVWTAYLNLENTYGTDEQVEEVFTKACELNDAEEVHSHLVSIYIQSAKNEKADLLLQTMVKRFSQNPKVWQNYGEFLFNTAAEPNRARQLLPRALQALPKPEHIGLTSKFAQLEFRSQNGESERGRTIFEGLISTFPKRLDLWNVLLDLEIKSGDKSQVRRLFERVTSSGIKPQKARIFFKKWLEFEERCGDSKSSEKVKAQASEFVRHHNLK